MKKIISQFVVCILSLLPSTLFAEPFTLLGEGSQFSPFTVKIGAGAGQAEYQYGLAGKSETYRAGFEYNPRNLGFEVGVNRSGYFVPQDRSTEMASAMILSAPSFDNFGYYLAAAAMIDKVTFSKTFLDLGPTLHFRPGSKFDPYIGAGLGIADIGAKQSTLRAYGKLGVRMNFERSFLFLELGGASINRHFQGEKYIYGEGSGIFGFGYYFGTSSSSENPVKQKEEEPAPPQQEEIKKEETTPSQTEENR
ncbi:hypothetical protein CH352_13120 [Leptospira hartskeerlii]|uniref:Outer membrane protein beta-barrel domain-containing protein n=1 Tax=Leptospira hartskeerlii TaxID=2023177 RepID=A0A2M9XAC7_9LEPT|nr:hypothetical protein [Leptospira hartskeerlii]PJZ24656.1 hypothetical protein CH357_13765 [Leptospira hartskeerlii]PJZ33254.1 hypothetical protein CH352_13120 [Leptospira hartskeerlii]